MYKCGVSLVICFSCLCPRKSVSCFKLACLPQGHQAKDTLFAGTNKEKSRTQDIRSVCHLLAVSVPVIDFQVSYRAEAEIRL